MSTHEEYDYHIDGISNYLNKYKFVLFLLVVICCDFYACINL